MPDAAHAQLLPRSTPSAGGIDAHGILAFLDAVDAQGIELHSLMIVRGGAVVAEGWWHPYAAPRPHLLYSLSKSVTSLAVGWAVAEGRVSLTDRVIDLLPDAVPDPVDPRVAELTLHHVLSMSTGHIEDTLDRARALDPDITRGFLRIPPERPVGSCFVYNNATTFVCARIVEKVTGTTLVDYLRPRLFDPLGIRPGRWITDAAGQTLGFTGLHLTTESIAALGQLVLQDGVWDGRHLVPAGWVDRATSRQIDNSDNVGSGPDWRQGYGYQFWMSRHGVRGDGAFGQFSLVLPAQDAVIVTTACVPEMQPLLDLVWTHLLPAFGAEGSMEADAVLAQRLAGLRLTGVIEPGVVAPGGQAHGVSSPRPETACEVLDAGDDTPLPNGSLVTVTGRDEGWSVRIRTDGRWGYDVSIEVGHGRWFESRIGEAQIPVLAQGTQMAGDRLAIDVILAETPHRFRLSCSGLQCSAEWNAPPLSGTSLGAHLF